MNLDYIKIFAFWPPELAIVIISMIPIAELRVGLPLALTTYNLPWLEAFFLAFLGNMIPVFFILKFIGPVSEWLSRHFGMMENFFRWLFAHTRNKTTKKYEKYGLLGLLFFVAIPLPVTGAWTGALAAWLFGTRIRDALIYIGAGVFVAGLIVSILTFGIKGVFLFF